VFQLHVGFKVFMSFRYDATCELSVAFKDEEGIDGGGLTKTLLTMVSALYVVGVNFLCRNRNHDFKFFC
jgi:hypothetical protein